MILFPDGTSELNNREVRRLGKPPNLDFAIKDHVALREDLRLSSFFESALNFLVLDLW